MKANIALAVAVVAVIIAALTFIPRQSQFGSSANSGNVTNFDAVSTLQGYFVNDVQVLNGSGTLTQGGGVTATSSAVSATLLASDFDTEDAIEVSLPVGAVTLTFPASTTFPIGTAPGSMREFTMFNASTTAGETVTIAGGTGSLLEVASSTLSAGLKVIQPSGVAVFTAWRKANSDIEVFMNPGQ